MVTLTRLLTVLVACLAFSMATTPLVHASDPGPPPESADSQVIGTITGITVNPAGKVTSFVVTDATSGVPVPINTPDHPDAGLLNGLKDAGTTVTVKYKPATSNLVSMSW